jgi:hypothetical protein
MVFKHANSGGEDYKSGKAPSVGQIGVIPSVTSPVSGARIMAKGLNSKKADKKKPAKTADEKRAEKKAKKTDSNLFGH